MIIILLISTFWSSISLSMQWRQTNQELAHYQQIKQEALTKLSQIDSVNVIKAKSFFYDLVELKLYDDQNLSAIRSLNEHNLLDTDIIKAFRFVKKEN